MGDIREGEIALPFDPATAAADAGLVFIGRIRSPWTSREDCPKNMNAARERGLPAEALIDAPYRRGLDGLDGVTHVVLLSWLGQARRDLIIQKPRHATQPRGTFSLRSPVRPNPIGLHIARLVSVDAAAGILGLDAIDVLDGTPLVDVKPYYASTDAIPEARTGRDA